MGSGLFDLSGRVAVVTGGTTGIGHAIALGLAEAGANVVPSSRRGEQVEKAAIEIEGLGRRSLRVRSDVLDRGSLEELHDAVIKEFGRVDILVNAAGVTYKAPTLETAEADGDAEGLPDLRQDDGQGGLWTDCQHSLLDDFCGVLSGGGLFRLEGGSGIADEGAGGGTGQDRRECECDCAGNVSDRSKCQADHRHSTRRGIAYARADGAVWQGK